MDTKVMLGNMPADRARAVPLSANNRSRFTNRPGLIPGIDCRTAAGRRLRDRLRAYEAEFSGVTLTATQRDALRQAALLAWQLETLQGQIAAGADVDNGELVKLAGAVKRLLRGLPRPPAAPAGRSLASILRQRDRELKRAARRTVP